MKKSLSTSQAAAKLGVSRMTLQRHIAAETFPLPKLTEVGGVTVRLWSDQDIARARKALAFIRPGRKKKK